MSTASNKNVNTALAAQGFFHPRHVSFLEVAKEAERYNKKPLKLEVDTRRRGSFIEVLTETMYYLSPGVTLQPEYFSFACRLPPCPRHILDYLLFFGIDPVTNLVKWNQQTQRTFERHMKVQGVKYSKETIKKGTDMLRKNNVIVNKAYGEYMMNPLIHSSKGRRRELFKTYNMLLEQKGQNKIIDMFPRYR